MAGQRSQRRKRELKFLLKRGEVWYFRKECKGAVTCLTLDTSDEYIARARRDALLKNISNDKWDVIDGVKSKRNTATIGEVIEKYSAAVDLQLNPSTMRDYCWAIRHILKKVKKLEQAAVDLLPVTVLDGGLVREWQRLCLAKVIADGHGGNRLKEDTAAVSANSLVAQARSLFSERAKERKVYEGLQLPELKEFLKTPPLDVLKRDGYQKPPESMIVGIWKAAHVLRDGYDLGGAEGPPWKRPLLWLVFWTVSQTGLRRSEDCALRYGWFAGDRLKVTFEADFVAKGKRERWVPVSPTVETECRRVAAENGWATSAEDYVIPGTAGAKEELFKEFGPWMAENGWTRRQKAHELRKIFASDLTEVGDPYDTQMALGHQDIKTTMRYAARRVVKAVDQSLRYAA